MHHWPECRPGSAVTRRCAFGVSLSSRRRREHGPGQTGCVPGIRPRIRPASWRRPRLPWSWRSADELRRNFPGTSAFNTATSACPGANAVCAPALANFTTVNGVTDTEMRIWGMGITQNVDAAASTLYVGYRNFDAEIRCAGSRRSRRVRRRCATCRYTQQEPADRADLRHHRRRGRKVLRDACAGTEGWWSTVPPDQITTHGGSYESRVQASCRVGPGGHRSLPASA